MIDLVKDRRDALAALCRKHHVRRLDVFGSAATGESFDPDRSDVDFLVEFKHPMPTSRFLNYFSLQDDLEALLGRPVDLVESGGVSNTYIRRGIESSRTVLYAA